MKTVVLTARSFAYRIAKHPRSQAWRVSMGVDLAPTCCNLLFVASLATTSTSLSYFGRGVVRFVHYGGTGVECGVEEVENHEGRRQTVRERETRKGGSI